jgi:hypothetical protein
MEHRAKAPDKIARRSGKISLIFRGSGVEFEGWLLESMPDLGSTPTSPYKSGRTTHDVSGAASIGNKGWTIKNTLQSRKPTA